MTLVIAHRGASAAEPENSLAAFRRAVAMGAGGIELDVHATGDGALVVRHDDAVAGHPVWQLTLGQVRGEPLPNGERVPTLAEALAVIGTRTTVFVEVKTLPASRDALLLSALAGGPAPERYHVHSFDHRVVRRLQQQAPQRTFGVLSCSYPIHPLEQLEASRAMELWQYESLIDADLVRAARGANRRVYAWTVDDPGRIRSLRDLGVDGVCSNRPDVARDALA